MPEAHHHHDSHSGVSNIRTALWINASFAVIEIAGGLLTNSIAVLSDALHDAGDTVALAVAWYFQKFSEKKRDAKYSFGYRRFSVLGALINSMILFSGSCIILYNAVPRIWHPQPVHAGGMLWLAVLGIAVNLLAYTRLHRGHGINERVLSLHLLEDVLGWIAVLVVSIVLHFRNIPILDPILSVAITLFILYRLFRNLRQTFRILLQGIPEQATEEEILHKVKSIPEIGGVHDLHLWTMDGTYNIATLHLEVNRNLTLEETEQLKLKVRNLLEECGIHHATLEIEISGRHCSLNGC